MLDGNPHRFAIVSDVPVPKILGTGRRKGRGKNLDVLRAMKLGDSIWEVPWNKVICFKDSARKNGMKIRVRRLPDKTTYAIWRVQ